ncbi:MAG: hypothetical protein AAF236_11900 [Verrucomicrobiota bacterium]
MRLFRSLIHSALLVLLSWQVVSLSAQENQAPPVNVEPNVSPTPPVPEPPREGESSGPIEDLPDALKPWRDWVLWDHPDLSAAPLYSDASTRIAIWPSVLNLDATANGAAFTVSGISLGKGWLALPGSSNFWPREVRVSGEPVVVLERQGQAAVKLSPGAFEISGVFLWDQMPQQLPIPMAYGRISLQVNGSPVELPNWGANGNLWLKRSRESEAEEQAFLETRIDRLLKDGSPLGLETRIELSVTGKSREEIIGTVIPEGWQISSVRSAIPSAIEPSGLLRAQVRAGKWVIEVDAFRTDPVSTVAYADGVEPVVDRELIGFVAAPDFRIVELQKITQVDASQTNYHEPWRRYPVYRWDPSAPFVIEEKLRGMGLQQPAGLSIEREFWLDGESDLLTFRDRISGSAQQTWRLDVSPGQALGAARMSGEGQLITQNPVTGASGLEIRDRSISIDAVGRIDGANRFPASGWEASVDQCSAKMHLPPGWRVLALFGSEWVEGDWLTNWTLLDLFVLLVFTMAVLKLWGWIPAAIAFFGFGMAFHEPGAPKYLWLVLLVPLAILKTPIQGVAKQVVEVGKWVALVILLIVMVPFVAGQLQGVVYPQLENDGKSRGPGVMARALDYSASVAESSASYPQSRAVTPKKAAAAANLQQDEQALIQTGPAIPTWKWREIKFGWRGPVVPSEEVRVLLISPGWQRVVTIARVGLLILLLGVLLSGSTGFGWIKRKRRLSDAPAAKGTAAVVALSGILSLSATSDALAEDFPTPELLDQLEMRLTESSDAFPGAAEIPSAQIKLQQNRLSINAVVHLAEACAVPIPGQLAAWSPVSVQVNGESAVAVVRRDGFLWVLLEAGVNQVSVSGLVPNANEWELGFQLRPRSLSVEAPDWTVTGLKANSVPEDQILFSRKVSDVSAEAAYDRSDLESVVRVERVLEIGLDWQVNTTVRRLSPKGRAVALNIPLLPGERVLSSQVSVNDGVASVQLSSNADARSWRSELPKTDSIALQASESSNWVERWQVQASPVWNVRYEGLDPIYEQTSSALAPIWRPWPGETTTLQLSRPAAIEGETVTIRQVEHIIVIGSRQRTSTLRLDLQASLGQDLPMALDPAAEITRLTVKTPDSNTPAAQPVRRDGDALVLPIKPGEQSIELQWKLPQKIGLHETADQLSLPVEGANVSTRIELPSSRWVLWTHGPLRGPAVTIWSLVLLALIGAFILGRFRLSPLRSYEWALLIIGLTQVHPASALFVIGWFFVIAWRGSKRGQAISTLPFNFLQLVILLASLPVVIIVIAALHRGLLGTPLMMVEGNGSRATWLNWFAQRAEATLPEPGVFSVSIWYYRLLMLGWALWLAVSAVRWVRWGWQQMTTEVFWKKGEKKSKSKPPAIPEQAGEGEEK